MEIINPETLEKVSGGGLVSDMMGPSLPGEEPQKPETNGIELKEIGF